MTISTTGPASTTATAIPITTWPRLSSAPPGLRCTNPPIYDGDNGIYQPINLHHAIQYGYIVVDVNDLDVRMTWMEGDDAALGKGFLLRGRFVGAIGPSPAPSLFRMTIFGTPSPSNSGLKSPTPGHMLGLTELSADANQIRVVEGLQDGTTWETVDLRNN